MKGGADRLFFILPPSSFILPPRVAFPPPGRTVGGMAAALLQSDLPFPVRRGKVRDVYDLGTMLLIVATDRISAFDCVMPYGIPDKGTILTALSLFWFEKFAAQSPDQPNHLIAAAVEEYPTQLEPFHDQLRGRSML